MSELKRLYPSSMAFNLGGENVTTKNGGCHRYRQLAFGVPFEIPSIYQEIGELNEELWEAELKEWGEEYEREKPFRIQLSETATISGRMDFFTEKYIDECKATASSSMKSRLNKGEVDKNHLAQLCVYLGCFERTKGRLVYGYFQLNNVGMPVRTAKWVFMVELKGKRGNVYVEGYPVGVDMAGLAEYVAEAGSSLNSDLIAGSPLDDDPDSWKSPCRFCPLKDACLGGDFVEGQPITAETRLLAQNLITGQPVREAKLTKTRNKKFHVPK